MTFNYFTCFQTFEAYVCIVFKTGGLPISLWGSSLIWLPREQLVGPMGKQLEDEMAKCIKVVWCTVASSPTLSSYAQCPVCCYNRKMLNDLQSEGKILGVTKTLMNRFYHDTITIKMTTTITVLAFTLIQVSKCLFETWLYILNAQVLKIDLENRLIP